MATAKAFRYSLPYEPHFEKLIDSSAKLSYDPDKEIDWAKPLDPTKYGLNPEWCTLYGTAMWDGLTEDQKITLTRHEVASIMSTGIWFETLLQSMVLRSHYSSPYGDPEFRFALVEIADECRHSLMFSKTCEKLGAPAYRPPKIYHELGRLLRTTATPEVAFAAILAAEEVLDLMQRDWMRGEDVLDEVRVASKIHVVEEARHMKYARIEVRKHLENMGPKRRHLSALTTAIVAAIIIDSLVCKDVYAAVGLDPDEAKKVASANPHRREMMKLGAERLMGFFNDIGFLTPEARLIYRRAAIL